MSIVGVKNSLKEFQDAVALVNSGQFEEATKALAKLLNQEPANPDYLWQRAFCWEGLSLPTLALRDLTDAAELYVNANDKKKCQKEIERIKAAGEVKDNPKEGFVPTLDLAIFFHAFYNYTKLKSNVPTEARITDMSLTDVRKLCLAQPGGNHSPNFNLTKLLGVNRDMDHLLFVDYNNLSSVNTQNQLAKYNEINGELAGEDLILMLEKGISPPTRSGIKQLLLKKLESVQTTTQAKKSLADTIKKVIQSIPDRYPTTKLMLEQLLGELQ